LRRTYHFNRPFLGAIVAGEWTDGALTQLESQGIRYLLIPSQMVVDAFATIGVDAKFGEGTPDALIQTEVENWENASPLKQLSVVKALAKSTKPIFDEYLNALQKHLDRSVVSVQVINLYGTISTVSTVEEAITKLEQSQKEISDLSPSKLLRIEVKVVYSDQDEVEGKFGTVAEAVLWLEQYHSESAPWDFAKSSQMKRQR